MRARVRAGRHGLDCTEKCRMIPEEISTTSLVREQGVFLTHTRGTTLNWNAKRATEESAVRS